MKIIKPIYFAALALLTVLLFTTSAINYSGIFVGYDADVVKEIKAHAGTMAQYSRSTLHDTASHQNTVNYITGKIKNFGIDKVDTKFDLEDRDLIDTTENPDAKRYAVMTASLDYEDVNTWYEEAGINDKYYGLDITLKNIIVHFPGTSGSYIVFFAHYDSPKIQSGAVNNLGSVGAMLEAINKLKDNYNGTNGLLFVFTDGGEVNSLGAYAFKSKFIGFDNAVEKIKAAFSFDAFGNVGPLSLYSYGEDSGNLIGQWAKNTAGVYSYSGKEIVSAADGKVFDAQVFGGAPYLNFAVIDGRESYNTPLDNTDNFNSKAAYQVYSSVLNLTKALGSYDLTKLSGGTFGIFGLNTFSNVMGNSVALLVIGLVVMVLLVAGVVVLNIFKKEFSFIKAAIGAGVLLLSVAAACVMMYTLYYLVTSILAVTGFIDGKLINVLAASNIPLVIGWIILAVVLTALAQHIFKPWFKVKAPDIAKGGILLFAVMAVATAFFALVISSALIIFVIFQLALLALCVGFNKIKLSFDYDRLMIYAVPVVLMLPLFLGVLLPVAEAVGVVWYPLIMLMACAYFGFVTPYFSYLRPILDRIAKKLPKRTIRIEREVEGEKPHRNKKGKEIPVRKVFREKIERKYTNRFGLGVLLTISIMLVFIFGMSGVKSGLNLSGNTGGSEPNVLYIKDTAGVYSSDTQGNNTSYMLLIKDPNLYKELKYSLEGYKYFDKLGGYGKVDNASKMDDLYGFSVTSTAGSDNKETIVTIKPNQKSQDADLFFTINIPKATSIDYIEITGTDNNGQPKTTKLSFGGKTKDIILSNLSGEVTLTIKGLSARYSGTIDIEANAWHVLVDDEEFRGLEAFADVKNQTITAGIKITAQKSI